MPQIAPRPEAHSVIDSLEYIKQGVGVNDFVDNVYVVKAHNALLSFGQAAT